MPASYACSVIFFGNRCLYFCCGLLFLSLLGLLSINQAAEQKKKQQQTNKQTKQNQKQKKKHTKNWCSSGVFFFFFKVFTACAFYAQGANPTNKTTSVNTASFNSFFVFEKIITLTTCFRFVSRKGQQALKTRTVLFRWEKKFPRVLFSS